MRFSFIIVLAACTALFSSAQTTIEIADTNFRNGLCAYYDTVMTSDCLLDTIKAQALDDISLTLRNQNLVDVSEVVQFNRIDSIDFSYNNLDFFVEVIKSNTFWSLEYLDISNNQIEVLPRMTTAKTNNTLRHLYFQNNKATSIQNYWAFWDTLIVLNVSGNYLEDFSDASRAKEATLIDIRNNYLTFEDIIPQTKHSNFNNVFKVFPQRPIEWNVNEYLGVERDSITLHLDIDAGVNTNSYEWYLNDQLISTTTDNTLFIDTLKLSDAGTYKVIVRNSSDSLEGIYLESQPINLTVTECMDISFFEYNLDSKCYGADLSFDANAITGGLSPYIFYLQNSSGDIHAITSEKIITDTYFFYVEDEKGCQKTIESELTITPTENCDENVITPNEDGIQDDIYFTQSGEGIIYNQFGQEINRLALPNFWNAQDENGNTIPPGKYVIIINGNETVSLKVLW